MKRILFIMMAVFLASGLILGCAAPEPAPTPTPTPAPTPTPTPAPAAEPIELSLGHHDAPGGPGDRSTLEYAAKVAEVTDGQVIINTYPAAALIKPTAALDDVVSGVADMSWGFVGFFTGRLPLTDVLAWPCLGVPNAMGGSLALWNNYQKFPEIQAEYSDVKLLVLHTHQGAPIGTKEPVSTLADLKGMKIRSPGGGPLDWLKAAGATPQTMPPLDIYPNMEKGVIDGWTIDMIGAKGFKLNEVTNYYTKPYYYVGTFFVIMNKDTWNSIPADLQEKIESVSGEWAIRNIFAEIWDAGDEAAIQEMGITPDQILTYSDAEWAKAVEIGQSLWPGYVEALEADGKPAQAVLDETIEFLKNYK